jgi:hypothetical protein
MFDLHGIRDSYGIVFRARLSSRGVCYAVPFHRRTDLMLWLQSQFLDKAQSRIDMQNRPKYMFVMIRWLTEGMH